MNRYDFWATISKVYCAFYWFAFRKELAQDAAEATLKGLLAAFLRCLYNAQQAARNGFAGALRVVASKVECVTLQNEPEVTPVVEVTIAPTEVVEASLMTVNELETAYEVPHERKLRRGKGKARADYKAVKEPIAGSVYWYKRGRRWVECMYEPQRLAA